MASLSKSWNAECKGVATWSFGSDAEGAGEADVWRRSNNLAKERVDNGSDFTAARIWIKLCYYNLLPTRNLIKLYRYDLLTTRFVIKLSHISFMSFRALVKSE